VDGLPDRMEDKRNTIKFKDIMSLSLEFCNLRKIENLNSLQAITKLQLCNNVFTKIEGLSHLVNLTWLDLRYVLSDMIYLAWY
jgi:Leucine-rich repeat (LRR) protein